MFNSLKNSPARRAVPLVAAALALALTASVALADDLVQPDQRLNQVVYFGGDALYCVDSDYEATTNYGEMVGGGMRLLDISGQELLFVPYSDVAAAVTESQTGGEGVVVATGSGSYGPVTLTAYSETAFPDTATFTFSGSNEWGKPESLTFTNCFPEGPEVYDNDDE